LQLSATKVFEPQARQLDLQETEGPALPLGEFPPRAPAEPRRSGPPARAC
jgi:hypothetical protein